jgi:hypothetical protein
MAAGKWGIKKTKRGIAVTVTLFESLRKDVLSALEAEAQDVGRFLGKEAKLKIGKR